MGRSESSSSREELVLAPAIPYRLTLPSHSLCTLMVQGDRHHSLGIWLSRM